MNVARSNHQIHGNVTDCIISAGGALLSSELYNGATWTTIENVLTDRYNGAGIGTSSSGGIVMCGYSGGSPSLSTEVYSASGGTWSLTQGSLEIRASYTEY